MSISKKQNIDKIAYMLSLFFMLVFSLSFLAMSPASKLALNEGDNSLLIATGIVFWLSLVIAYALFIFVNFRRKQFLKKRNKEKKSAIGLLRFFSNTPAKIADIATVVGFLLFLIFSIFTDSYFIYVFLAITVFAFQMHCVLNGENYLYINSKNNVRRK